MAGRALGGTARGDRARKKRNTPLGAGKFAWIYIPKGPGRGVSKAVVVGFDPVDWTNAHADCMLKDKDCRTSGKRKS